MRMCIKTLFRHKCGMPKSHRSVWWASVRILRDTKITFLCVLWSFRCHALIWHERLISPQREALASGTQVDVQQASVAVIRIHDFVLWCLWEKQNDIVHVCGSCFCAPDHKNQSDTGEWLCEGQHQHSDQSAEALWELLGHHGQHQEGDLQAGPPAPAEGLWSRTQQQSPGRPPLTPTSHRVKKKTLHAHLPKAARVFTSPAENHWALSGRLFCSSENKAVCKHHYPLAWYQTELILPRT